MTNEKIRLRIDNAGLRYWQVADEIGITPYCLSTWLRHELEGERLERVTKALDKLEAKGAKE